VDGGVDEGAVDGDVVDGGVVDGSVVDGGVVAGGVVDAGAFATSDADEGRGRNTRDGVRLSPASHTASHASPGTAGGMSQLAWNTPGSISRGADSTPSETSTRSGAFLLATPVGSTTNTRTPTVARVDAETALRSSTANGSTGSGAASLTCLLPTTACVVPGGTTIGTTARPVESARTGPNQRSPTRAVASPFGFVFTSSSPVPASGIATQP
jgi:hypothetical protein